MTTYKEFTSWLFPNQETYRANPSRHEIPEEVVEVLDQISNDTGIPEDWLYKTAGLVVDGLAGLKCLWYLHGAEGYIDIDVKIPDWVDVVVEFAVFRMLRDPPDNLKRLGRIENYVVDWKKGTVTFTGRFMPKTGKRPVVRDFTVKLGSWLEKYIKDHEGGMSRERIGRMRSQMKSRAKSPRMVWRISAHPYDVLTMSFKRPWSSCMRPDSGHEWQYGILTDLAAGSAIMFFYEEGADVPAGRLTLRPALDEKGNPCIFSAKTIYGRGPSKLTHSQLNHLLDVADFGELPVYEQDICKAGRGGRALSRLIYSDLSGGCKQTEDEYDEAYDAMQEADWPESDLDLGELLFVAEMFTGDLSCELPADNDDEEGYEEDEDEEEQLWDASDWFQDAPPNVYWWMDWSDLSALESKLDEDASSNDEVDGLDGTSDYIEERYKDGIVNNYGSIILFIKENLSTGKNLEDLVLEFLTDPSISRAYRAERYPMEFNNVEIDDDGDIEVQWTDEDGDIREKWLEDDDYFEIIQWLVNENHIDKKAAMQWTGTDIYG